MSPFIKAFIKILAWNIGSGDSVKSRTCAYPQWGYYLERERQSFSKQLAQNDKCYLLVKIRG